MDQGLLAGGPGPMVNPLYLPGGHPGRAAAGATPPPVLVAGQGDAALGGAFMTGAQLLTTAAAPLPPPRLPGAAVPPGPPTPLPSAEDSAAAAGGLADAGAPPPALQQPMIKEEKPRTVDELLEELDELEAETARRLDAVLAKRAQLLQESTGSAADQALRDALKERMRSRFGALRTKMHDKKQQAAKAAAAPTEAGGSGARGKKSWRRRKSSHKSGSAVTAKAAAETGPTAILKDWFYKNFEHPYPSDKEKDRLAAQAGMTRLQVSNWLINQRVRLWKPTILAMRNDLVQEGGQAASQAPAAAARASSRPRRAQAPAPGAIDSDDSDAGSWMSMTESDDGTACSD